MLYTYETPSHATILLAMRELHPKRRLDGSVEALDAINELKKERLNLVRDLTSRDIHEMVSIHDFVETSQDFFGVDDEVLLNTLATEEEKKGNDTILKSKKFPGVVSFFWIIARDNKYFGCLAVRVPNGKKFIPQEFKTYFELEYATFQSMYDQVIAEARQKAGIQPEHEESRETIDVDHLFSD